MFTAFAVCVLIFIFDTVLDGMKTFCSPCMRTKMSKNIIIQATIMFSSQIAVEFFNFLSSTKEIILLYYTGVAADNSVPLHIRPKLSTRFQG